MLVRAITGQQLSVKAADSIWKRFVERFAATRRRPSRSSPTTPRSCGWRAASAGPRSSTCARWPSTCVSGELELDRLPDLPDDEVIRELTAVKGIGEWTAHMFLMFTLQRPDVLPTGDLGVRNAAMRAYGLDAPARTRRAEGARRALASAPDARLPVPVAEPGQRARLTRLPSCTVMRRLVLAALLACAMAGCGGGGDGGASDDPVSRVPEEGGLQENVRAASAARRVDFPSADGKTLNDLAEEVKGGGSTEVGLATSVFTVGENRLAFGDDRRPGPVRVRADRRLRRADAGRARRGPVPGARRRARSPRAATAPARRPRRPTRSPPSTRRTCSSTRRARGRCWR